MKFPIKNFFINVTKSSVSWKTSFFCAVRSGLLSLSSSLFTSQEESALKFAMNLICHELAELRLLSTFHVFLNLSEVSLFLIFFFLFRECYSEMGFVWMEFSNIAPWTEFSHRVSILSNFLKNNLVSLLM